MPVVAEDKPGLSELVANPLIVQESAAKFARILCNAETFFSWVFYLLLLSRQICILPIVQLMVIPLIKL